MSPEAAGSTRLFRRAEIPAPVLTMVEAGNLPGLETGIEPGAAKFAAGASAQFRGDAFA